jgi:hypothetical protein
MPGEWVIRRPHPAVRHLISRYLGYAQRGVTLGVHRGLPSRHVTLIIGLAEPIRVIGMPGPGRGPAALPALVGGMHLRPALIAQDRFQAGVHVELDPLGCAPCLGCARRS